MMVRGTIGDPETELSCSFMSASEFRICSLLLIYVLKERTHYCWSFHVYVNLFMERML